ncbi:hypothetical protein ARMGADRAFT_1031907 [Armillaria gallica]|uniref:Uncharacterized protein n=1 Tax=Armillaria gallica TaxID=47427 RepID=A0A2H3DBR5_ARMGA|nr:hypothetical protein ARMGADRAFT_1031907 [Armillaria gallica]
MPLEWCYVVPSPLLWTKLNLGATQFMVLAYRKFQYVRDFELEIKTGSLPVEAAVYCHAANIDSNGMQYSQGHVSAREAGDDCGFVHDGQCLLKHLCKILVYGSLSAYMGYRNHMEKVLTLPKLLIFSRDGVSEGKFKHILDPELLLLQGTNLVILMVSSHSDYSRCMPRCC